MKEDKPKREIFFYEDPRGVVHEIRINYAAVDDVFCSLRKMGCKIGSDSEKVQQVLDKCRIQN